MSASDSIHPDQLALFSAAKFRGTRSSKPPQQAGGGFELTPTTMPGPRDRMASPLEHPHNQMQLLINPTEHIKRVASSTDLTSHYYNYLRPADVRRGDAGKKIESLMQQRDVDRATPTPGGKAPNKAMSRMWRAKERESKRSVEEGGHGAGLYDKLKSGEQVRNPIQINMNDIANPDLDLQHEGHHRIAAGAALERERGPGSVWMPVEYSGHIGGLHGEHNLHASEVSAWQAPEAQAKRLLSKQARQARNRANMNDLA